MYIIVHSINFCSFIVSHQLLILDLRTGGQSWVIFCKQINSTTAIESGCVIARKAIKVDTAGLKGSGRWCKTINLVRLALLRRIPLESTFHALSKARLYIILISPPRYGA